MIYAIIAVLCDAIYIIKTKNLMRSGKRIDYGSFFVLLFLFLFIISFIASLFVGSIQREFFSFVNIITLILAVLIAGFWNVIYYRSLHEEKLVNFELVVMIYPLITIFLASVFLPKEFNAVVFVAGLIGVLSLVLTQVNKSKIIISRHNKNLFFAVVLMAIEAILIRKLLDTIEPTSLYAIRTASVMILFILYFRKKIKKIKFDMWPSYLQIALFATTYVVMTYYAFVSLSVSYTILILLMVPVLLFVWGYYKEKEKLGQKKVLSAIIISLCIILAYMVR